jgi:thiol-disulfide isomerase/thioredoxin
MSSVPGITSNLRKSDFIVVNGQVSINPNVHKGNPGLLLIWASWCPHCVNFKPVYQNISKKLNSRSLTFPCVAIEQAQMDDNLTQALNFRGFPTLKFFDQNGNIVSTFDKQRTEDNLLREICDVYHQCYM